MDEQRLADSRAYKLMAVHMKEPPDAGVLFPSLRAAAPDPEDAEDVSIFQAVTASLSPYNR